MKHYLVIILSCLVLFSCKTNVTTQQKAEKNYVLLVSFDGFRYENQSISPCMAQKTLELKGIR